MLPDWINALPFRLGTTSYILQDDILPNVRYLAGQVRDIELLLFEMDDGQNNLPDDDTLSELRRIGVEHDLSFTVHLPLDLDLGAAGAERSKTLDKAQRAIEAINKLDPWAYVLHLDGNGLHQSLQQTGIARSPNAVTDWLERAAQALKTLGVWAGDSNRLAIENLDGYPPDFSFTLLERISAAQCVDIGHLWKDGADPISYLNTCLPRTRVIHLHGIGERDHQSLAHMPAHKVDEVISLLTSAPYSGIITLEVFSQSDLFSSLQVIRASLMRIGYLRDGD